MLCSKTGGSKGKKGGPVAKSKPPSAKKEKTIEKEKTKMTEKDGKGEGQDGEMKEEDIIPVKKEAIIGMYILWINKGQKSSSFVAQNSVLNLIGQTYENYCFLGSIANSIHSCIL